MLSLVPHLLQIRHEQPEKRMDPQFAENHYQQQSTHHHPHRPECWRHYGLVHRSPFRGLLVTTLRKGGDKGRQPRVGQALQGNPRDRYPIPHRNQGVSLEVWCRILGRRCRQ